jgi:L-ascorbate metabolism protein UlaG (beta-lactamase superfamily)
MIEIIHDHAGIVEHVAVLQKERGDLAQRILLPDGILRVQGIRVDDLNAIGQPENRRREFDLPAEGRCG